MIQTQSRENILKILARDPDMFNIWYEGVTQQRLSVANAMRAARPLPPEAEKLIDDAVVRVGRERLRVAAALVEAGLTKPLPNWMAVPQIEQRRRNEYGVVMETMTLHTPSEHQIGDEDSDTTPVFARIGSAQFDIRTQMTAARSGLPLDTEGIEQLVRRMNEMWEEQTINGSTLSFSGNTATGLGNAPNVNTMTFESNAAWDAAAKTGPNIKADVLTMVQALRDANHFGPYMLVINDTYENALQEDYFTGASGSTMTIQEAIEEMYKSEGGIQIVSSGRVPANTVYLLEKSSSVIDVIVGDYPTATQWSDTPGLITDILIISCLITRSKDNYDGQSGIVIGTPT